MQLLMKAVPESIRSIIISSRAMQSTAILYNLLKTFQPGGAGEKQQLLQGLTSMSSAANTKEFLEGVRLRRRKFQRADEIGASIPDPTLMIKSLDEPTAFVCRLDAQAGFRLAQARSDMALDAAPTKDKIWNFSQCIMAELESLVLMEGPGENGGKKEKQQVRVAQATTSSPLKPTSSTPCRWWCSEEGCHRAKKCKFVHDWTGCLNKEKRCWVCSSLKHGRYQCPHRDEVPSMPKSGSEKSAENQKGKGKGKGGDKSASKGAGKSHSAAEQQSGGSENVQAKVNKVSTESTHGGASQAQCEVTSSTTSSTASSNGAGFSGDVQSLIKTLQGSTAMRVLQTVEAKKPEVRALVELAKIGGGGAGVLLDSGATHPLRKPKNGKEWQDAAETTVQTATGECRLKQTELGTLLTTEDVCPIVPLGAVMKMGAKLHWESNNCRLQHPTLGNMRVWVDNNCPYVSADDGRRLVEEIEKKVWKSRAVLKALSSGTAGDLEELAVDVQTLRQWFPEAPEEQISMWAVKKEVDTDLLPFNRKFRKKLRQAEHVAIHLFSGPQQGWWRKAAPKGWEIVCIDLGHQQDFLSDDLFAFVIQLIKSGKVRSVVGGPPCRTVSVLRSKNDGGPRQLRSRFGNGRWGIHGLRPFERSMVDGDNQLWLRTLVVAKLVRQFNEDAEMAFETPEDPWQYKDHGDHPSFSCWPEVTGILEEELGLKRLHLDQGAVCHERRKPTILWSDMIEVQRLDGLRDSRVAEPWFWECRKPLHCRNLQRHGQWA